MTTVSFTDESNPFETAYMEIAKGEAAGRSILFAPEVPSQTVLTSIIFTKIAQSLPPGMTTQAELRAYIAGSTDKLLQQATARDAAQNADAMVAEATLVILNRGLEILDAQHAGKTSLPSFATHGEYLHYAQAIRQRAEDAKIIASGVIPPSALSTEGSFAGTKVEAQFTAGSFEAGTWNAFDTSHDQPEVTPPQAVAMAAVKPSAPTILVAASDPATFAGTPPEETAAGSFVAGQASAQDISHGHHAAAVTQPAPAASAPLNVAAAPASDSAAASAAKPLIVSKHPPFAVAAAPARPASVTPNMPAPLTLPWAKGSPLEVIGHERLSGLSKEEVSKTVALIEALPGDLAAKKKALVKHLQERTGNGNDLAIADNALQVVSGALGLTPRTPTVAEKPSASTPAALSGQAIHTVQSGETLTAVAQDQTEKMRHLRQVVKKELGADARTGDVLNVLAIALAHESNIENIDKVKTGQSIAAMSDAAVKDVVGKLKANGRVDDHGHIAPGATPRETEAILAAKPGR